MNVKIVCAAVGQFTQGQVVSSLAFVGGDAEVERLVGIKAVVLCEDECTVFTPASVTAVAEMVDDELVAENSKLKEELAKLKAELEAKAGADDTVVIPPAPPIDPPAIPAKKK